VVTGDAERGLDGIQATFRGHAAEAPRARFTRQGDSVWEFGVRLTDSWLQSTETVTVRVADQHYNLLQRWVVPGRQVMIRGTLHPVRWTGKDGKERMRLLVEPTLEVMPLEHQARGSEPAALHYGERRMPQNVASVPRPTATSVALLTKTERAAQMRALLNEENPT
jgi:single-stranded DNA-binding protein